MPFGIESPNLPNPNVGGSAEQAWLRGGQMPQMRRPAAEPIGQPTARDLYGMPVIQPNQPQTARAKISFMDHLARQRQLLAGATA